MSDAPSPSDIERQRRLDVARLARALRQRIAWQQQLAADGAPLADAATLEALQQRFDDAQRARTKRQRAALFTHPSPEHAAPPAPAQTGRGPAAAPDPPRLTPPEPKKPKRTTPSPSSLFLNRDIIDRFDRPKGGRVYTIPSNTSLAKAELMTRGCTRCRLHVARKNIVFGDGNPDADLVFLGPLPSVNDNAHGRAFIGSSKPMLDGILKAMRLSREQVFMTHIVKCRSPHARPPEPDEVLACQGHLIQQLRAINPKVIVALGRVTAQALLNTDQPLRKLRGRWHDWNGYKVMPTLHPGEIMRERDEARFNRLKKIAWSDFKRVMAELGL